MPDERAVMTSVSSYYHTFSGAQKVLFDLIVFILRKLSLTTHPLIIIFGFSLNGYFYV